MIDFLFELLRAVITALIFLYLWLEGRKAAFRKEKGWFFILAGFGLILFGTVLDISDNFPSLDRFVIVGDTPVQAFLEKVVGYLGGFLLLAAGFRFWIPAIASKVGAEQALRESEEKFRAAFETNPDVGIISRIEDGVVVEANRGFYAITGYTPEEVIGRSAGSFLWNDTQVRDRFIQGLRREGKVENIETSFVMKDGSVRWGLVSAGIFTYRGAAHYLTVGKDITHLKTVEKELEDQNVELRKLDEIKDGLIRDVSHELKTPVAKQAMHLEMLRAQLGEHCAEKTGKIIEVMERCVRRQEGVIGNILSLSRLSGGQVEFPLAPVRLDRVMEMVIDDYALVMEEKGVDLQVTLEPLSINGNEEMLWHVFANLLGNAFKFRSREREARIDVSLVRNNGSAVVVIADNGIGLSREHVLEVFDRFFQVSASVEGSGIGLSICRETVMKMRGEISLDSPGEDRGARVTVIFPLGEKGA